MINYVRNTGSWEEALALTSEQFEAIQTWANETEKREIEKLNIAGEKINNLFIDAVSNFEKGKKVDYDAVVGKYNEIMSKVSIIALNKYVEDGEITLLSKGIEGTSNVMVLVGYGVCALERSLLDKLSSITNMANLKAFALRELINIENHE